MSVLFCDSFDMTSKFIFDFYDFDKDNFITKEDIRTVLSYLSLNIDMTKLSSGSQGYLARVNSQEELHNMLEYAFSDVKADKINYIQFLNILEDKSSDIYIYILLFLLEKKPFTKTSISEYSKQKNIVLTSSPNLDAPKKFIASPVMNEKSPFSLTSVYQREQKKHNTVEARHKEHKGDKFLGIDYVYNYHNSGERGNAKRNTLLKKLGRINEMSSNSDTNSVVSVSLNNSVVDVNDNVDVNVNINMNMNKPVCRKTKTNLKDIPHGSSSSHKNNSKHNKKHNDIALMPAYKQSMFSKESSCMLSGKKANIDHNNSNSNNNNDTSSNTNTIKKIYVDTPTSVFENSEDSDEQSDNSSSSNENENVVKYEGYLYKVVEGIKQPKKLWFKLIHKDLYFFKNDRETQHKGMHNLSGVFLREDPPQIINNRKFFKFSIIYPSKERSYYVGSEFEYQNWISFLKAVTGFTNLTDIYTIEKELGSGKFGLVKLGTNKLVGNKIAIKILDKKEMEVDDLELVRTEIEILRICQHPNIIHLYDVFENESFFYLIMEYCSGGDLFSYLEQRNYMLKEKDACIIIYKLCKAIYYIHSYGIVHRDIKPENILMTSNENNADIRLLDFGLGKILGPGEFCHEPFGTLSYVAPEVLCERPYNKAVDLWSVGVTTYLLLCGFLPFDDPDDDTEIARKTINEPVRFKGIIWKGISKYAINFIQRLLDKNPETRMNITETLEHSWFSKMGVNQMGNNSNKGVKNSSLFKMYTFTNSEQLNDKKG